MVFKIKIRRTDKINLAFASNIAKVEIYSFRKEHSFRKQKRPSFEYYECPIEIDEKGFYAVVSVKIIVAKQNDRRIYYHHYLDGLKNQTVLNSSAQT